MIRVGVPITSLSDTGEFPWLVSANALYNHKRQEFKQPDPMCFRGTALDSAGYVAMARYGGYPWHPDEYARFGALNPWDWWASMDFCCEPELGHEASRRVARTAEMLGYLNAEADDLRHEGAHWSTRPMPVLQGWLPEDYALSVKLTGQILDDQWPDLIGIGSMCRRDVRSAAAIFHQVARSVPATTKIHLFGVKSAALRRVHTHPQFASIDSCAYDMEARWRACKGNFSNTLDHRRKVMREWVESQSSSTRQLGLFNENPPRVSLRSENVGLRPRNVERPDQHQHGKSRLQELQKIDDVATSEIERKENLTDFSATPVPGEGGVEGRPGGSNE